MIDGILVSDGVVGIEISEDQVGRETIAVSIGRERVFANLTFTGVITESAVIAHAIFEFEIARQSGIGTIFMERSGFSDAFLLCPEIAAGGALEDDGLSRGGNGSAGVLVARSQIRPRVEIRRELRDGLISRRGQGTVGVYSFDGEAIFTFVVDELVTCCTKRTSGDGGTLDAIGESIGTLLTFTVIEGVSVVGALHA